MKTLDSSSENTGKISKISEIMKKKETNLPRNSSLYFQIGLILCLLASYGLFEMKFKHQVPQISFDKPIEDVPFYMPEVNIERDAPKQKLEVRPVAMLTDKPPTIKPNDTPLKNLPTIETPDSAPTVDKPNPTTTEPDKGNAKVPIKTEWNMIDVERVPIFPGCESANNNAERMACMSEKLSKFIQRKFNTNLASDLGLSGVQKIYVQFKIDANGRVTDIKSRSPYAKLEDEAERVVGKLPTMTPGMQRDTPVSVIYNLPITFQVQ